MAELRNEEINELVDSIENPETTEEPAAQPDKTTEETPKETPTEETSKENESNDPNGEQQTTEAKEEPVTPEPSQETASVEDLTRDFEASLPQPPLPPAMDPPQYNEEGQLINMTPPEFLEYATQSALYSVRQEAYANMVENQSLDVVEKFLPEIKTNPEVRKLVENARIAQVVNGQKGTTVEAAKEVRKLLDTYKGIGKADAKVSVERQSAAAIESGASQVSDGKSAADKELTKRLQRGDTDAFADLMDQWQEEGKV